jgi:GNAT superfamily N-acetyltransferase
MMTIDQVDATRWLYVRDLCLRALHDAPNSVDPVLEADRFRRDREWFALVAERSWFAVEVAGRPVGVAASGATPRRSPSIAFVSSLWVAPEHRRTGIGRLLLEHTCSWAESEGFSAIAGRISTSNCGALALFASLGFSRTETNNQFNVARYLKVLDRPVRRGARLVSESAGQPVREPCLLP